MPAPRSVEVLTLPAVKASGAAEVAVLTPCHDPAARRRSYRLLAEAFGLAGGGAAEGGRLAAA